MAGGKGTRISSVRADIPKPMIPVNGKPILEWEIINLRDSGLTDITIVVGHLGSVIKEYFQDGARWKVDIDYFTEEKPLGTAGALYYLKEKLTEPFLLINGDILFDVDFKRMIDFFYLHDAWALIFAHPNDHPYDSGLIVCDSNNRLTNWLHKEDEKIAVKNRVNAGIHIISPKLYGNMGFEGRWDLDRDLLKKNIVTERIYVYESSEYVKDMGTPERLLEVEGDIKKGKIRRKCLKNKQKAVFIDRDGTINVYKGFIYDHAQIELIPGVADAIKKINESDYLCIVITNQPVIARGECTLEELGFINNTLETLLGEKGAYIDDLFYCPHHPDKGFEGERIEFKIDCQCRKPKIGLLLKAAEKYNIDLKQSYMVGDEKRDLQTAYNANCEPILISEKDIQDIGFHYKKYKSLIEFVEQNIVF